MGKPYSLELLNLPSYGRVHHYKSAFAATPGSWKMFLAFEATTGPHASFDSLWFTTLLCRGFFCLGSIFFEARHMD